MSRLAASMLAMGLAIAAIAAIAAVASPAAEHPDDLSGWQATPMKPDPGLSDAARSHLACQSRSLPFIATQPPPLVLPMQVVLQDRRTPETAAFVVATVGYVGACILSPVTEGAGWLNEERPLPAMADAIAIDGLAAGGLVPLRPSSVWGNYGIVWGRADARVASVRIDLGGPLHEFDDDDRVVTASVGGGYWLGWWTLRPDRAPRTGDNEARVITGLDAQGNAVVALELRDSGYGSDTEWVVR